MVGQTFGFASGAAPARTPSRPPNQGTLVGGREGVRAGAALDRQVESDKQIAAIPCQGNSDKPG